MKESEHKFWIIIGFWAIGLILILLYGNGCKPNKPSHLASQIVCGSDGIKEGWFAYAMTTGDICEQEGVEMKMDRRKNAYLKNNGFGSIELVEVPSGIQEIKTTGITGAGGRVTATGKRLDPENYQGRVIYSQVWFFNDGMSGAFLDYATITKPLRQQAVAEYNSVLSKYYAKSATFSTSEKNALENPTEDPPESGIEVTAINLLQQQGGLGEGFPKELNNGFIAGNLTEPDRYLRYSAPFMFSFTFKTSRPEQIIGVSIPVRISTNANQHGISLNVTVISSNASKTTHVARTDGFLPVRSDITVSAEMPVYDRWTAFSEPNIWNPDQYSIVKKSNWLDFVDPNLLGDPNTCPDPNVLFNPKDPNFFEFTSRLDTSADNFSDILIPERIKQFKTISIGTEDFLYFEIDWNSPELIMMLIPHWLESYSLFDLNNDGIVNFKDLP